ncbi:hypothetical protein G9A89_003997 [Geosiphon pyriformis]|nr:hypothetical protein G9A89_003997 [Geosiphon pyriformis]
MEDSFGQFFLGHCYFDGISTSQDRVKVFELWSKAAEAGNINAQKNLRSCYLKREEKIKNEEKAFELYSKTAEVKIHTHYTILDGVIKIEKERQKSI